LVTRQSRAASARSRDSFFWKDTVGIDLRVVPVLLELHAELGQLPAQPGQLGHHSLVLRSIGLVLLPASLVQSLDPSHHGRMLGAVGLVLQPVGLVLQPVGLVQNLDPSHHGLVLGTVGLLLEPDGLKDCSDLLRHARRLREWDPCGSRLRGLNESGVLRFYQRTLYPAERKPNTWDSLGSEPPTRSQPAPEGR